jgi:hypothetical protein
MGLLRVKCDSCKRETGYLILVNFNQCKCKYSQVTSGSHLGEVRLTIWATGE